MRPLRAMARDARHAWRTHPEWRDHPRPWIRTRATWAAPADLRFEAFGELRRFRRRIPWRWLPRRVVVAAFAAVGISDELGERLTDDYENWKQQDANA